MKFLKYFACSLAPVLMIAALVTAGVAAQEINSQLAAGSVLEKIKKRGLMKIGHSTFIPWAMRDKKGGLIGFEIDVAKRLAKNMGVEAEFLTTPFDGIIPALLSGKFDIIITGMAITTTRNLTVNFTNPYEWYSQGIVANKKVAEGFTKLEDFNRPDVVLVLRRGGFTKDIIEATYPKAQLRFFDDDQTAIQEVLNGNAHATITAEPKPTFHVLENPDILFTPFKGFTPVPRTPAGFAIRKGDPDSLSFFNNWILQRWEDGYLQARNDYWFTTRGWFDDIENNPFLRKN